jgi:hypothetical protein
MSIEEAKEVIKDFLRAGKDCGRSKDEIEEALRVASESMEHLERILWSYMGARMFDGRKDT